MITAATPDRNWAGFPEPPRHFSRSARPEILAAAKASAGEHGYECLQLRQITTAAEISHQAFYGHFANKRHAVAAATSEQLGTIVDLATGGAKRGELWAQRMLADVDRTLIEAYPAENGPERRLRDLLTEVIQSPGGYNALRIAAMVRVSRLGHGEFYRRYGGKRGCLRRIYGSVLDGLRAKLTEGDGMAILDVGQAFAADPSRSRLLILGATHLPVEEAEDDDAATQGSLPALLAEIAASSSPGGDERALTPLVGGVLEIVRAAVLGDRIADLEGDLRMLRRALGAGGAGSKLALVA